MKHPHVFLAIFVSMLAIFGTQASAQNLPASLSFTVSGSFENGVGDGNNSILITDNNLTDGYAAGMDLQDAPTTLNPNGPAGSAAFQWGDASTQSNYPHTSALWFEPIAVTNVASNEYFDLGNLYYRNGTIFSRTGASSVNLALNLNFSTPSGLPSVKTSFTSDLINSPNTGDPVASADTVSLRSPFAPVNFTDASGNRYFLELSFRVDQNTLDGTLSTQDQFKVFEGGQGRAELLGRFTTAAIPEPSSALLAIFGLVAILRRKR
jgi:hypothetical protein